MRATRKRKIAGATGEGKKSKVKKPEPKGKAKTVVEGEDLDERSRTSRRTATRP